VIFKTIRFAFKYDKSPQKKLMQMYRTEIREIPRDVGVAFRNAQNRRDERRRANANFYKEMSSALYFATEVEEILTRAADHKVANAAVDGSESSEASESFIPKEDSNVVSLLEARRRLRIETDEPAAKLTIAQRYDLLLTAGQAALKWAKPAETISLNRKRKAIKIGQYFQVIKGQLDHLDGVLSKKDELNSLL
jgi:hypothetical protein